MPVIQFPQWRVFFFLDDQGRNIIRQWLDELEASDADRHSLQALLDICEYSGPEALSNATLDLADGFYALKSKHKGGMELSPVFIRGPFSDSEITFLAGAQIVGKTLKPRYAAGIAQENLEILQKQPSRRRRERIT
jgi:hypothetical protein